MRVRKALVAAQVMLSLLLLIGAGLFIRSLRNLRDLGPGFTTGNLVAFELDPSLNGYNSERSKLFYRQLDTELKAIPGVRSVGLAFVRILENNESDSWFTIEGYHPKATETPDAYMNWIGPGYLRHVGCSHSWPGATSRERHPRCSSMATSRQIPSPWSRWSTRSSRNIFSAPLGNAIGRHAGYGIDPGTKTDMEIVGVIKDIKYTNLRDEVPIQMFEPYLANDFVSNMTVYVRTAMNPDQLFSVARSKVRGLDANLPHLRHAQHGRSDFKFASHRAPDREPVRCIRISGYACWPSSGCMALWRTPWPAARVKLESAWHWGPFKAT